MDSHPEKTGEYRGVLNKYRKVFEGEDLSLSELMIEEMRSKKISYFELISNLSQKNKQFFIEADVTGDDVYLMTVTLRVKSSAPTDTVHSDVFSVLVGEMINPGNFAFLQDAAAPPRGVPDFRRGHQAPAASP